MLNLDKKLHLWKKVFLILDLIIFNLNLKPLPLKKPELLTYTLNKKFLKSKWMLDLLKKKIEDLEKF